MSARAITFSIRVNGIYPGFLEGLTAGIFGIKARRVCHSLGDFNQAGSVAYIILIAKRRAFILQETLLSSPPQEPLTRDAFCHTLEVIAAMNPNIVLHLAPQQKLQ